ncbi:hypothetical protein CL65_gp009 [Mycobacterium phage Patience]|uniref:Uncharacterized protein n=1 Tax=Mycobacterium phage Patience TaxID=1074308 RepID=A0A2H4ZTI9_9CAUD|nr:hypothetical protein CL65_gp009 [Mycobacterium phage Patience]AUG45768.1 hypothetical protein PATIENCE_111 [Mycobacterium phage Patience]UOW93334.1 hypothetical protein SEA_LABELLE_8 [Mycobacterium phage Labelle]
MARIGRRKRRRFSVMTKFVSTKYGSKVKLVIPGLRKR